MVKTKRPIPIINMGQRLSNLAQEYVSSRSELNPIMMMNTPIIRGHIVLLLPPKHISSSLFTSRRIDLYVGDFSDTPQFTHILASSMFSVPHFVQ